MTTLTRLTVNDSTAKAKAEIKEMLTAPVLTSRGPETVTAGDISSFSDLHDYTDANMLGAICDDDVVLVLDGVEVTPEQIPDDQDRNARWFEFGNRVQDNIDAWIKTGGHR